jgi:hypothetical protein
MYPSTTKAVMIATRNRDCPAIRRFWPVLTLGIERKSVTSEEEEEEEEARERPEEILEPPTTRRTLPGTRTTPAGVNSVSMAPYSKKERSRQNSRCSNQNAGVLHRYNIFRQNVAPSNGHIGCILESPKCWIS